MFNKLNKLTSSFAQKDVIKKTRVLPNKSTAVLGATLESFEAKLFH
jgi:hypothetical protein